MSILSPTAGELIDRATILELKVDNGRRLGMDVKHFEEELRDVNSRITQLDEHISGEYPGAGTVEQYRARIDSIVASRRSLALVNSVLWQLEDSVRATADSDVMNLAKLCKSIASINDSRAKGIRDLNVLYHGSATQEKVYGHKK